MEDFNHEITQLNAEQIINMGGPYVCDLYINDKFVANKVVVDDYIFNVKSDTLYFVKYYPGVRWQRDSCFKIICYNLQDDVLKSYDKEFDMVYIKAMVNDDEMEIYLAFHFENTIDRRVFNLTTEAVS